MAIDVAVTMTCDGEGTADGAVYKPVCEMLPLDAPPATLQVTAALVVPETVALNCCVLLTATLVVAGATVTEITDGLLELPQPTVSAPAHINARLASVSRMKASEAQSHFKVVIMPHEAKASRLIWALDYEGGKKGCGNGGFVLKNTRPREKIERSTPYSISRQFGPAQTSTSSGTVSL